MYGSTVMETTEPLIVARGLTRIYQLGGNEVVGVNAINLDISAGQLVVLKGNSGSGKSTLLALLAGLDLPTQGLLRVAGTNLNVATPAQLTRYRRQVVGMVFQSFNLLPTLNVLENVALPALLAGREYAGILHSAQELLDWLGLAARRDHLPSQLSGGEMQRTAIARALINDPAIILADEPTGNLDTHNSSIVLDLLVQLNREQERTVVIATHSSLADRYATMTIHLEDGAVVSR